MFDSGISLASLIEDLKEEVDIAYPISNRTYVLWANSLEQLLYREIIQEQKEFTFQYDESDKYLDLSKSKVNGKTIRFEDIYTIFAGHVQLTKSTVTSGHIFPNVYYKDGDKIMFNVVDKEPILKIIYFDRPELKTVETVDDTEVVSEGNVMLPVEFVDMMKAKLRGEAYKLANEDSLAAKWINDYNVLLETFKAWIANKAPEFGM